MLRNRLLVIIMLLLGLTCLACHKMQPAMPELPAEETATDKAATDSLSPVR